MLKIRIKPLPKITIPPLIKPLPKITISIPKRMPAVVLPLKLDIKLGNLPPLYIDKPVLRIPKLNLPPPLPKSKIDIEALKQATGIIVGAISLNPIRKGLVMGVMGIADAASKGEASKFINNGKKTNGTLDFLPGGSLTQKIANVASKGKSGDVLTRYVPDPKKMVMNGIGSVGKEIIVNPKNTLNKIKSVGSQNIQSIKNNEFVKPTLAKLILPASLIPAILIPTKPTVVVSTLEKMLLPEKKIEKKEEEKTTLTISKPISIPLPPLILPPEPVLVASKSTLEKIAQKTKKEEKLDYTVPVLGLGLLAVFLLM